MTMCILADMTGVTGRTVKDPELKAYVKRLCELTGRRWEVEQHEYARKRILRQVELKRTYSIYLDCHGEWQVINFPPTGPGDWTINSQVDYRTMTTMLHWYIYGLEEEKINEPEST